jgi:hypothetical protein
MRPFLFQILLSGFRYGIPMLIHRTPIPNCSVLMEKSRCATNPVHGIEQRALETKDQRSTQLPSTYVQSWVNRMTRDYNITAVNTPDGTKVQSSPSIYSVALATGLACGILILIYMWRSMKLDSRYAFTILSSRLWLSPRVLRKPPIWPHRCWPKRTRCWRSETPSWPA